MGLPPLAYWDCGFESRRGHGCLSLVSVVCCQVEVSAKNWALVQRSPTECGVSQMCVIVKPRTVRQSRSPKGLSSHRKEKILGTWSLKKVRSMIRFLQTKNIYLHKIHHQLIEAYGNGIVTVQHVSKLCTYIYV
jgi:hypothetical protein